MIRGAAPARISASEYSLLFITHRIPCGASVSDIFANTSSETDSKESPSSFFRQEAKFGFPWGFFLQPSSKLSVT